MPVACPDGNYCTSPSTSEYCADDGAYCPVGSTIQRPCLRGYFCPKNYQQIPCRPGYWCPDRVTQEEPCLEGFYCPVETKWKQNPCGPGTLCPAKSTKPAVCDDVGIGMHCGGQADPTPCDAGSFCPNATAMIPCAPGDYCPRGADHGFECMPGSYSAASGASICKLCELGKFATGRGSKTCDPCQPGSYSDYEGAPACKMCGSGQTSPTGAISSNQCTSINPNDPVQVCTRDQLQVKAAMSSFELRRASQSPPLRPSLPPRLPCPPSTDPDQAAAHLCPRDCRRHRHVYFRPLAPPQAQRPVLGRVLGFCHRQPRPQVRSLLAINPIISVSLLKSCVCFQSLGCVSCSRVRLSTRLSD